MTQAVSGQPKETGGAAPMVLIVDDDASTRKLLRTLVEDLGIPVRVEEAADGDAVMDIVRFNRPDLVLLDIVLPDSRASGVILCRVLSKDPRTRVVIVTGTSNDYIQRTCLFNGAIDCVRKPFDVDQMRSKLARWLGAPAPVSA